MKNSGIGRRHFLGAAATGALGAPLAKASAEAAAGASSGSQIQYGEPYELAGKRLFFLNWYYIRPGSFAWRDENGKTVGLTSAVPPGAAHFTHVDQPWGIRLVARPAERMGPLLQAEAPWEEDAGVALTTVIKDGGMFRGWGGPFTVSGDPPGQKHFYNLESSDGLTWKRPKLGIVEVNGSRANNVVNIFETDGGTIFVDPSAPASERYKLIAEGPFSREICDAYLRQRPNDWDPKLDRNSSGGATGMKGAASPDGVHWTMFPEPMVM
ncbi:MAG: hypothetical protein AAB654_13370, partial [Acidobacteriota bacterium]